MLGGWPKSSCWVQKADFPRIGPKVFRIDRFGHKFSQFWEAGQNQVFECKKQIFQGSAQKCAESLDFNVIFAKSGWLAQTCVFCYFFVFSIALGQKNADFRRPEAHLRGFGGSWRRPGQALTGFWGSHRVFWALDAKMFKLGRFLTPSWGRSWRLKIIFFV